MVKAAQAAYEATGRLAEAIRAYEQANAALVDGATAWARSGRWSGSR